jgi:chromosome segregation ATPase
MDMVTYLLQEIDRSEALKALLELVKAREAVQAEISAHDARIATKTQEYNDTISALAALKDEIVKGQEQSAAQVNAAGVEQANLRAQYDRLAADLVANHKALTAEVAAQLVEAQASAEAEKAKLAAEIEEYETRVKAAQAALAALKGA